MNCHIVCLFSRAMNYAESLLVFGMSEISFFFTDVIILDVSIIITKEYYYAFQN